MVIQTATAIFSTIYSVASYVVRVLDPLMVTLAPNHPVWPKAITIKTSSSGTREVRKPANKPLEYPMTAETPNPHGYSKGLENFTGDIITEFLHEMNYPMEKPIIPRNESLEIAVTARLHKIFEESEAMGNPVPARSMAHILKLVKICASSTELPYHSLCFDLKVFITVYTCLFFYCDDMIEKYPEMMASDVAHLPQKFSTGQHMFKDALMTYWLKMTVEEACLWYGPTLSSLIVNSTLTYLVGAQIEATVSVRCTLPKTASRFPHFLRMKTGNGEAYSAFLFPINLFPDEGALLDAVMPIFPDFMELLDGCNDIMSFYKESVVGTETGNYFMSHARMTGQEPVEVIREVIARQVMLLRESTESLSCRPDVQAIYIEFMEGYLMWHGSAPRYRLHELGIKLGPQE